MNFAGRWNGSVPWLLRDAVDSLLQGRGPLREGFLSKEFGLRPLWAQPRKRGSRPLRGWLKNCQQSECPAKDSKYDSYYLLWSTGTFTYRKKDFDFYPLKLKALDSALDRKRLKARWFRQKLQTTSPLQSPVVLWDLSHYTVTPHSLLHFHFPHFVTIPASNDSAR
jgi:hypothetical protein